MGGGLLRARSFFSACPAVFCREIISGVSETDAERVSRILSYDDTIDMVCNNIAGGQTLIGLCESLRIPYGRLNAWLKEDDHRWARYQKAKEARKEYFQDFCLETHKKLGSVDVRAFYDAAGAVRPMAEWTEDMGHAVASLDTSEINVDGAKVGETRKIKFWDKQKALESLAKLSGAYTEKVEHSGSLSLEQLVLESYKGQEG